MQGHKNKKAGHEDRLFELQIMNRFTCWKFELGRPGSDLLSRVLRQSTIGDEAFHVRVRNGIGCFILSMTTKSSKLKVPTDTGKKLIAAL